MIRFRHRGFTIVELIVTIAIIATLGLLTFTATGSFKSKAHNSHCKNNLRQISAGLELYLGDNNNLMPTLAMDATEATPKDQPQALHILLLPYVSGKKDVFHCPADGKEYAATGSSYFWNTLVNGQNALCLNFFGNTKNPESIPLVSDKEAFHGDKNGSNILYADYSTTENVRFSVGNLPPRP